MKKDDIKENVDNMLIKVLEYIKVCDLSDEEDFGIKIESALSIIMSAIDITDDPVENLDSIIKQQSHILTIITLGMTETIEKIITGDIKEI